MTQPSPPREPLRQRLAAALATALAPGAVSGVAADAADAATGSGAGSGTIGLLVVRSTVTLRTGSGAATESPGLAGARVGAGAGPDSSSGTINTMSTTKIDAPTRRSLTRRSILVA